MGRLTDFCSGANNKIYGSNIVLLRTSMKRLVNLSRSRTILRTTFAYPQTSRYATMSAPKAAETDTQAESIANTTGITVDSLFRILTEKLEAKHVDVEDISGQ